MHRVRLERFDGGLTMDKLIKATEYLLIAANIAIVLYII